MAGYAQIFAYYSPIFHLIFLNVLAKKHIFVVVCFAYVHLLLDLCLLIFATLMIVGILQRRLLLYCEERKLFKIENECSAAADDG